MPRRVLRQAAGKGACAGAEHSCAGRNPAPPRRCRPGFARLSALRQACAGGRKLRHRRLVRAHDRQALLAAIKRLECEHGVRDIVVQEFLGGREYTVGIIGNVDSGLTVLPIIEFDYSALSSGPRIQCYGSKWDASCPSWTGIRRRKAEIGEAETRHMENAAVALFGALGCRDYARFDFRAGTDGVIRLLEVNPNPSWCWDANMAVMAETAGLSYAGMLQAILDCAWKRAQ